MVNRRQTSKFTPSNVTEVRRRFDRILKHASQKADEEMKAPLASLKPALPAAATWRRTARPARRPA